MKDYLPIFIITIGLVVSGIVLYPEKPNQDSLLADRFKAEIQEELIVDITITEDDHIKGDFNAPITIVTYSDFGCGYCAMFHETLKQVSENYPEQVRLVYKHFLINEATSFVAEASECVWEQRGDEGFQQFSDLVFRGQISFSDSFIDELFQKISLSTEQFNECIESGRYLEKIQRNYEEGSSLGVKGTPNSFINGESITGALSYEKIEEKILSNL